MALSLSRAFGAMGAEASKFDRRKAAVDPELGLLSAEDMQMHANFMLPGPNMVRTPLLSVSITACSILALLSNRRCPFSELAL